MILRLEVILMSMIEKSCAQFLSELASKSPVPGGGGASALCGALGTALGCMVGNLTVGKARYAAVGPEILELLAKCNALRAELLALVDEDAKVFAPLAAAYALPKNTEEESRHKDRVMEDALFAASEVPLKIMGKSCEAIELLAQFAEKGSRLAVSDAGVGAALCKAALEGAALNVFINTTAMKNRAVAGQLNARADEMLKKMCPRADEIYAAVAKQLRPVS